MPGFKAKGGDTWFMFVILIDISTTTTTTKTICMDTLFFL